MSQTIDNFPAADAFTSAAEGGLSLDSADPGNWTGGAVGAGVCLGTFNGISAAAYPLLDIRNMSFATAASIRRQYYWGPVGAASMPAGISLVVYDFAVNAGVHRSAMLLQQALGVMADGVVGPVTLSRLAAAEPRAFIAQLTAGHEVFYSTMRDAPRYARALDGRAERCKTAALALLPPPAAPADVA